LKKEKNKIYVLEILPVEIKYLLFEQGYRLFIDESQKDKLQESLSLVFEELCIPENIRNFYWEDLNHRVLPTSATPVLTFYKVCYTTRDGVSPALEICNRFLLAKISVFWIECDGGCFLDESEGVQVFRVFETSHLMGCLNYVSQLDGLVVVNGLDERDMKYISRMRLRLLLVVVVQNLGYRIFKY
jgi:hypothetical protein